MTVDRQHIRTLATNLATAQANVREMGLLNVPTDVDKRIAQDAVFRLAVARYERASAEYNAAILALSTDELNELAQGSGASERHERGNADSK